MPLSRQLYQIDYDQFHRYAATAALLRPLLEARQPTSRPVRLLEVGSHSLHLLPAFLSPLPIEVVRADLEPGLAGDLGTYVTIEPDQPLPFADGSFDYTIALEVLEHIPGPQRGGAVREWGRVASQGVLFSCPSGNRVKRLERRVDADFQARHGREHPWLEEHERFGRPTRRQVMELCRNAGLVCHRLYNSPLEEWLPLLLITERLFESRDAELLHRFSEMINRRPQTLFQREPGYRSLYAAFPTLLQQEAAFATWHHAGLLNQFGRARRQRRLPTPAVDPLRALAERVGHFLIEHRKREVDATQLSAAQRQVEELSQRLTRTEQELAWERHQRSVADRPQKFRSSLCLRQAAANHLVSISPQHWQVEGVCPTLEWQVSCQRGWHRIVVEGVIGEAYAAMLHLDYGQGFNDTHVIPLAGWHAGRHLCAFNCYFDHPVSKVRLRLTLPVGRVLELNRLDLQPRSSWRVVWDGMKLVLPQLLRAPQSTWKNAKPTLLRYAIAQSTVPPGLPHACMTPYQRWLFQERLSTSARAQLQQQSQHSTAKLGVLMTWKESTDLRAWQRTMESLHQLDECRWELWIAAEHADADLVKPLDPARVQWIPATGDSYRHIMSNLESAPAWLLELEPGDLLEPDAALQLLHAADLYPDAALLYADEDVIRPGVGNCYWRLKPRLLAETVRHQPEVLGRAVAVQVPTLQQLGGFNPSFEGVQLSEYFLRLQRCNKLCVQIPHVLLHQKALPPANQAVKLVEERLREAYAPAQYRIESYRTSQADTPRQSVGQPQCRSGLVSILIPSAGKVGMVNGQPHLHLERCLQSLRAKTTYDQIEILVAENGELSAPAQAALDRYDAQRVVVPGLFNFSRSINRAAAIAQGEFLLLLNDDIEVLNAHWLDRLLELAEASSGAVGAKLLFPTGLVQHLGISLKAGVPVHPGYCQTVSAANPGLTAAPHPCLAVTAACLLSPRRAFEAVGGFDESFELNYNDVDFCLRLWQAGYQVMLQPDAELYHYETMRSDGRAVYRPDELERFQRRWQELYPSDPFLRLPPGEGGL